jgi:hypothetical protein
VIRPFVLVLADADDIGVRRLISYLQPRCDVASWSFGAQETSVAVDADQDSFLLEQPGTRISSTDFAHADLIFYKRRWLQRKPLVISGLPRAADRRFSEREWTSLLEGLIEAEEHRSPAVWANPPSSWTSTSNKLALLLRASRLGVDIPHFTVATTVRTPDNDDQRLVAKAISADEVIDAGRYFATARLDPAHLRRLCGRRLPTPSLFQDYISPVRELRSYYLLGSTITISLTPSPDHVDIRYLSGDAMAATLAHLPPDIDTTLCSLAQAFNLNYCSFDLLVPEQGDPILIDITPAGSWEHFESDDAPFISDALGAVIEDYVTSEERSV